MAKKALIAVAAGTAAMAAIAGIVAFAVHYIDSRNTYVWTESEEEEESETTFYRDIPDPTTTTTRETQGRAYYDGGGYKGMDNYYTIQDMSVDEIIAEYENYHDIAHKYNISDLKSFDKELKRPAHTQVDSTGYGLFMFYDLILPDEKIDHIASFNVAGNKSTGAVEFTMKMRIHDPKKVNEIYNAFVNRYSEGSQDSSFYNMMNMFDTGVKIKIDDSHYKIVCYKRVRDKSNNDYYLIHVSEENRK